MIRSLSPLPAPVQRFCRFERWLLVLSSPLWQQPSAQDRRRRMHIGHPDVTSNNMSLQAVEDSDLATFFVRLHYRSLAAIVQNDDLVGAELHALVWLTDAGVQ